VFTAPTWMMGLTVDLRGRTPVFLLTVAMTICDPVAAWAQPWRCLWRGLSQMTITRPWRRMTLHLSQIFLTLGWTFMRFSFA